MMQTTIFSEFTKVVDSDAIEHIFSRIASDKDKKQISPIRKLVADGNLRKANELKKQLLGFTPSGQFKGGRTIQNLIKYNPFICLDLDKIPEDRIQAIKQKARKSLYTHCIFLSPSGTGLKIFVKTDSDLENHQSAFNEVAGFYEKGLQIKVDRSAKDVTRLCFVSHDPDLYFNPKSSVFHIKKYPATKNNSQLSPAENDWTQVFTKMVAYTEVKLKYSYGNRNNFVYLLSSNCNRDGIPEQQTVDLILKQYDLDPKETAASIASAYKHHADEFGKKARRAREAREALHNEPISSETEQMNESLTNAPLINPEIYNTLPEILKKGAAPFQSPREKDIFLTGALTILSGCFPTLSGVYDGREIYANLNCFIVAPAASGKGTLRSSKDLALKIHEKLSKQSLQALKDFNKEMRNYKHRLKSIRKGDSVPEPPEEPPFKLLYIPANASSAAVIRHLNENDGAAIMCETESDSLTNALKQDWGGYSDMIRKTFHHETISYTRKTNKEFIEINVPKLSIALSGTPGQVPMLIRSAEDGLFSRFIFYVFRQVPKWRDVSPMVRRSNLTELFSQLGDEVLEIYEYFNSKTFNFSLTEKQWDSLNNSFTERLREISTFVNEDVTGSVYRLALIQFRLAMVLSGLRHVENGMAGTSIICDDEDFNIADQLTVTYMQHTLLMFQALPNKSDLELPRNLRHFYDAIAPGLEFSKQEAVKIGERLSFHKRTVTKYLKILMDRGFLEQPHKFGTYMRPLPE